MVVGRLLPFFFMTTWKSSEEDEAGEGTGSQSISVGMTTRSRGISRGGGASGGRGTSMGEGSGEAGESQAVNSLGTVCSMFATVGLEAVKAADRVGLALIAPTRAEKQFNNC